MKRTTILLLIAFVIAALFSCSKVLYYGEKSRGNYRVHQGSYEGCNYTRRTTIGYHHWRYGIF